MKSRGTFNSRTRINDTYPKYRNIKYFDLHRKHFLYGRIDRDGNAVQLNDSALVQVFAGNKTEFVVDFVKDAFDLLKNEIGRLNMGSHIERNSIFNPTNFKVHKAWREGDLEYSYYQHLNKMYTDFVQNYLQEERRFEKIIDFNSFLFVFSEYLSRIAYRFPLTKTGFILSYHCSPFVSGLALEISKERHGSANDRKILDFTKDPNFTMIKNATKRVGFLVDRNAPWRFVFNIASGGVKDEFDIQGKKKGQISTGGAFFMSKYGVSFGRMKSTSGFHNIGDGTYSTHIFDTYYTRTHLAEIENIRNYMFLFYSAYFNQFPTFTALEDYQCPSAMAFNTGLRLKYVNRKELPGQDPREPGTNTLIPAVFNEKYGDDFWLRYILKFRLLETKAAHTNESYQTYEKVMLNVYRALGTKATLNHINDLTKAFFETKFIHEGKYWYGQPRPDYEVRKKFALENAASRYPTELTAVLNKPK